MPRRTPLRQHAIPYTVRQVSTGSITLIRQPVGPWSPVVFDLELNDTVFVVWVNGRRIPATGARIDPGKSSPIRTTMISLLFHTVDHHRRSLVGQIVTITARQRQFTDRSLFNLVFQHFSELADPRRGQLYPASSAASRSDRWRVAHNQ